MNSDSDQADRREFIGQLATAALVVVGAGACTAPVVAQSGATNTPAPGPRAPVAPQSWDDSWTTRLVAKHRAVFDSPEMHDGMALGQAWGFMRGYRDAHATTDTDVQAVIVIRHAAIPMAFNDVLWEKYELGKELKLKDPTTGKPARRNPFFQVKSGDPFAMLPSDATLDAMQRRGAILLGCNLAAMGYAYRFAQRTRVDIEEARTEVRGNLVPTLTLQPNGIYAVLRAQEMGCSYMRSA